jgi:hypothetical protein
VHGATTTNENANALIEVAVSPRIETVSGGNKPENY